MPFFDKKPDPLQAEIEKLEHSRRELEKQMSALEQRLQSTPAPVAEESRAFRGATIPPPRESMPLPRRSRKMIAAQHRKARNRVIAIGVVLMVIGILIYRSLA